MFKRKIKQRVIIKNDKAHLIKNQVEYKFKNITIEIFNPVNGLVYLTQWGRKRSGRSEVIIQNTTQGAKHRKNMNGQGTWRAEYLTYLEGEHGREPSQQQPGTQRIVQRRINVGLELHTEEKNFSRMKALSVIFR